MTEILAGKNNSFRTYLYGVGGGHIAAGIQLTLFPWLIVGVLGESAERSGLAQMAVLLPNLLFILWGGALSDNRHLGSHLFRLYCLYTVPFLALLLMMTFSQLSYLVVLLFGVSFGVITAFVQPARESLLAQVTDQSLHSAVSKAALIQFSASSIGILLAGNLDKIGLVTLLCLQIVLFLSAAYFFKRCHAHADVPKKSTASWRSIQLGLKLVWHDKKLLHLMFLVAATGFLGMGAYLVAIPLLTRDIYHQGATFFAGLQFSFMGGVIVVNGLFMRLHHRMRRPGRALLLSMAIRSCLLLLLALELTPWLLFLVVFLWGCFSGMSMTLGRTMTHQGAPAEYRSRVVSIYQLALFGSAPLGAWVCGQMIHSFGVLSAITFLGIGTLLISIVAIVFGELWNVGIEPDL